jgi:hypothetical protein
MTSDSNQVASMTVPDGVVAVLQRHVVNVDAKSFRQPASAA